MTTPRTTNKETSLEQLILDASHEPHLRLDRRLFPLLNRLLSEKRYMTAIDRIEDGMIYFKIIRRQYDGQA